MEQRQKPLFLFFLMFAATACAAGVFRAAGAAFGTSDAFFAAFFGFVNIPSRKSDNCRNDYDYDNIFHNDCSFLLNFILPRFFRFLRKDRILRKQLQERS